MLYWRGFSKLSRVIAIQSHACVWVKTGAGLQQQTRGQRVWWWCGTPSLGKRLPSLCINIVLLSVVWSFFANVEILQNSSSNLVQLPSWGRGCCNSAFKQHTTTCDPRCRGNSSECDNLIYTFLLLCFFFFPLIYAKLKQNETQNHMFLFH